MWSKRTLTLEYFPWGKNSTLYVGEHLRVLPEKLHSTISLKAFEKKLSFQGIIYWLHCKNHILRLIAQRTSPQLLYGSTHSYSPTSLFKGFSCLCRGGPVCPPVSMISFDFGKTTAKTPFLQCNHILVALQNQC